MSSRWRTSAFRHHRQRPADLCRIPLPAAGLTLQDMVATDQAEASVLTAEWMAELEDAALANWSKLMGQ